MAEPGERVILNLCRALRKVKEAQSSLGAARACCDAEADRALVGALGALERCAATLQRRLAAHGGWPPARRAPEGQNGGVE